MGGHSVLGLAVHGHSADLHFHEDAFGDVRNLRERRVQALVTIGLGKRDVVLEAVGDRAAEPVEKPQRLVTISIRTDDHPQRKEVVDVTHMRDALAAHLAEDAVELLFARIHRGLDSLLAEVTADKRRGLIDEFPFFRLQPRQLLFNLLRFARINDGKRALFQLALQRVDTEPGCHRSKQL